MKRKRKHTKRPGVHYGRPAKGTERPPEVHESAVAASPGEQVALCGGGEKEDVE